MKKSSFFLKLNFLSIFAIFMLFVLGGLVRATGSGMGCPDWPKCFGEYIPPTDTADLPDNYREIFLQERLTKAERFASLLHKLGMSDKADQLLQYEQLREAHDFSLAKAYTEYINRLWGALTGIIVLLTFILSFQYIKEHKKVFFLSLLGFTFVVLNALLGAVVVNANLFGGLVTLHFLLAFAAISFFMFARFQLVQEHMKLEVSPQVKALAYSLMILIVAQLVLGTQVRENYDTMESSGITLTVDTISHLGGSFNAHRTLAIAALLLGILQFYRVNQEFRQNSRLRKYTLGIAVLIIAQVVFGSMIVMTDLSAFSKLFHISIGAALFVLQFYICRLVSGAKTEIQFENS